MTYARNTPGYVMTQATESVPVAIPIQPAGGVVPGQASYMYAQGGQATSVQVPIGAVSGQPQFVVAASPAGGNWPQATEMKSSID